MRQNRAIKFPTNAIGRTGESSDANFPETVAWPFFNSRTPHVPMEGDCEPTEAAAANASELSLVELFSNGFKIATKPLDFAKLLVATPTDIGSELTISPPWALEAKEKWKALNAQLAQTEPFSKPFAEISKEMVSVMDQASVSLDPWEIKAMYARTAGFDPELVAKLRFVSQTPIYTVLYLLQFLHW